MGARRDAGPHGDYGARASFVCAIAAAGLQAARVRPALELLRNYVYGLRDTGERGDREAIYGAAQAAEKRSDGGDERAGRADRGLPGPRRARADSLGAAGGSAV